MEKIIVVALQEANKGLCSVPSLVTTMAKLDICTRIAPKAREVAP